ncbi:MAG TPA: Mur ligase family protein [Propionibacteriaceae bacterium]
MASASEARSLVELRLLDGPNLYFPRPAAKVTLDLSELLGLEVAVARDLGVELGLGNTRPGAAGSVFRQRFAIRLVTQIVRRLASAGGATRLAVRTRTGQAVNELVVAYPWRNAGRAEGLAYGLARVLDRVTAGPRAVAEMIVVEGAALAAAPLGSAPQLIRPQIPVVAITGTNGKTTTARMIGHIARQAGRLVGWSSTDGVYIDGRLVEAGDFSGPSGAGRVLRHPGVELAVTETARGGILRRGVGVAYNDVSVVTNISADHLGLGGIDTLDQLAEVKAVITKITKPGGWCVLNADDPRTLAMRLGTKARIWVFTRDPDSPGGRTVLSGGGRMTTLLGGWVCVLAPGADPLQVVEVIDVPMTLAGLSRVNVENVLAVTSATLALGFSVEQVADGLRSFDPNENNPGRMNIWTLPVPSGAISVVIDLAHNEAGLEALLEIMSGIRPPHGRLLLGVGTAGDRGNEVFVRLGEIAAVGADVVEIVHKVDYLRGRSIAEISELITEGAAHAGMAIQRVHDSELAGLVSLVDQARDDDVVAIMTHQDREELDRWLLDHQATRDDAGALRAKVLRAGATP